jgi:hypothetical protein
MYSFHVVFYRIYFDLKLNPTLKNWWESSTKICKQLQEDDVNVPHIFIELDDHEQISGIEK